MNWLLLCSLAMAHEPQVEIAEDDWIVAKMRIDAPRVDVDKLVADPKLLAELDDDGVIITLTPDGECLLVDTNVTHAIKKVWYVARACPTATGWRHELHEEGNFKEYTAIWHLEYEETSVLIDYRVRSKVKVMVPQWVVNRQTRKALEQLMITMRTNLEK